MDLLTIIGACVVLGVLGQLFMKRGMKEVGVINIKDIISMKIFPILFQKYVFLGICFYAIGNFLWLIMLSVAELSYAYPLIGTSYILTSILAWFFFGEKLTFTRILGIILIALGAYFVI